LAVRTLDDILNENKPTATVKTAFDEIYLTALRASIEGSNRAEEMNNFRRFMRTILGGLAKLYLSLSQTSLAELLNVAEDEVASLLGYLHSVLDVPTDSSEPNRLLHVSFRYFLHGDICCRDASLYVSPNKLRRRSKRG
jgi:hypothetical protein